MDFVFVEDVARANLAAMAASASDAVYNVGCGIETSLLELLQALLRVTGNEAVHPDFRAERAVNPVVRRLACTRRASEELGFEARVSLDEGLRRLADWHKEAIAR